MKKEDIKELIEFFNEMDMNKIKIKDGDFEIELEKFADCCELPKPTPAPIAPAPTPVNVVVSSEVKTSNTPKNTINSPMVGTFYAAPSPGAAPFVKVGQRVRKGDVIGIIEAMKIMNEIEAEFDCQITEALVADGQPIEFAMPLFGVEKI
ncbi:acetyl-CoA carboxylase biotin carboxyl carrier protein [Campylobacter sp. RM9344]|uniref:Biotin carboxyl carrier protein of acetyl-CoA carboxylase n=1 Tax=Campylobacter californiensis TaxID=1032243 RepID=A0AAW3ZRU7_9BACT|nr:MULTISPECIES: acetyl-CoA carboxylase biotin carboxyl carrier protein [unclassified Campylobacter]MBE2984066.1 acetyl-CoA carboxylase biotin carboxyl carrier protein [Campylobacter sp. RM6883]MBE2995491.1 acetyl-CoA carboxylase biotin carboxyl carrier protein [Campylobacter sp. RM6913]MBE3029835.1 acetyl-CoA carboxylase biotin carboxyl carrier protein [Campylobacter sp. RM9344]MBE3607879.1 acetyl-CoA carboxylase biotin carboxyl carrier protein [Campylobacter sp. RM9337]QCD51486.1 acetyl-CoA 